jgi:hypothetical protein
MQNNSTNRIEAKKNLIDELKVIYSLVDVSSALLRHEASAEMTSLIDVTEIAGDRLYAIYDALEKEVTKEEKEGAE